MKMLSIVQRKQYENTFFHRLDPRIKIAIGLLFSLTGPLMNESLPLAILTGLTLSYMLIARLAKALLFIVFFFIISMSSYLFIEALIFQRLPKYEEYTVLTLTMLPIMCWGLLLGMTTPLERLVTALAKFRMPTGARYAIMVALRYASVLEQETRHLINGIRVRGLVPRFSDLFSRPTYTLHLIIVPLLIRSFKILDRMAAAAELRGLSAPGDNLCFAPLQITSLDIAFFFFNLGVIATLWIGSC